MTHGILGSKRYHAALGVLCIFLFSVLVGCAATVRTGPAPKAVKASVHVHGERVTVRAGHVHSRHCNHYRHGAHWYVVKGHVHKKGCGHRLVRGVWVLRT